LAEGLFEIALLRVPGAEAFVPRAEALHLLALARTQGVAVGVLVLPADLARQPLVVHHLRRGRAGAFLPVALGAIERAPFGTVVDFVLFDHETTFATDGLAVGFI